MEQGLATSGMVTIAMDDEPVSASMPKATDATEKEIFPVGTLIAGYRLMGLLGKGGEGQVYSAASMRAGEIGRMVAIKLSKSVAENPSLYEQTVSEEARLLLGVRHPGVVRVYSAGHVNGWNYSVMERIDGVSLFQLLKKQLKTICMIDLRLDIQKH